MNSKFLLLTTLVVTMGLTGCQTIASNSASDVNSPIKKAMWQKSGDVFQLPNDMVLKANESRIVFLRQDDKAVQASPIVVGIGADNLFQASLNNSHYSEVVICSDTHIINVQNMNTMNGEVLAQSKQFSLMPQTTTYLQVGLSATGTPVVQKVSPNQAMTILEQSTRQTHQISRAYIECSVPKPMPVITQSAVIPPLAIPVQSPAQNSPIRNQQQFTVLFDFDSTKVTSDIVSELGLMAEFIKNNRTSNIVLEGHTDSRGSDTYNNKLSLERANTAKSILVNEYGVDSMKVKTVGYGESNPVDTNSTDQGRQNNRRVVATVISEQ